MPENNEVEIDFKADKNNNNIPDWLEFIATYAIAGVCIYLIFTNSPSESLTKWLITTAAFLAGGRDVINKFMR